MHRRDKVSVGKMLVASDGDADHNRFDQNLFLLVCLCVVHKKNYVFHFLQIKVLDYALNVVTCRFQEVACV